ncbi:MULTISPECIES: hypothetical protein [Pseudomonadati]|uniref:Uncharacterized protein n=1 Tax=Shewanella aestuarii TaxID=1028752 RepID=A0ABT0L4I4_9GAMM|nr:hypothetical protein [Shewanella aestuarii]MCL1118626.1 hypothetical protein [Shewanella aestuarii]GGN83429.1 hypothetical protein GCM10009193_31650 [Shewanella aestuarii]
MSIRKTWILAASFVCFSQSVNAQDAAEAAFTNEVIQCAAYYQIASEAIGAMNAPQMQAVGERLKVSALDATTLAEKYRPAAQVVTDIAVEKDKQKAKLGGSTNLGALMGQYKDLCKTVVYEPQKRLDYWAMATM